MESGHSTPGRYGLDGLHNLSRNGHQPYVVPAADESQPSFLGLGPCTLHGVQYTTCSTTANVNQRKRLSLELSGTKYATAYGDIPRIAPEAERELQRVLLSIQRRAASGITINSNYTWSHCISDHPQPGGTAFGTRGNVGWTNGERFRDRGNCDSSSTDRRHMFSLSSVADTPTFTNPTLRAIGSNWRFSPIFRVLSGEALTVNTNQDRALTGMSGQRVNQVMVDPYGDKTFGDYLNPAAFETPALGTFGNVGMGSVKGPGYWQFDLSLARTFQFRETQKLEFRAEAFNVTNSVMLGNPQLNLNTATFGEIDSARDPRILQFALKYVF